MCYDDDVYIDVGIRQNKVIEDKNPDLEYQEQWEKNECEEEEYYNFI